jgi:hypothetical protein
MSFGLWAIEISTTWTQLIRYGHRCKRSKEKVSIVIKKMPNLDINEIWKQKKIKHPSSILLATLLECNIYSSETNCTVKAKTPKNHLFTFFLTKRKDIVSPRRLSLDHLVAMFPYIKILCQYRSMLCWHASMYNERFRTHAKKFTMADCTTLFVCSTSNLLETESCFITSRAHCWSLGFRNAGNFCKVWYQRRWEQHAINILKIQSP